MREMIFSRQADVAWTHLTVNKLSKGSNGNCYTVLFIYFVIIWQVQGVIFRGHIHGILYNIFELVCRTNKWLQNISE